MRSLKFIDLFAGLGGFHLALKALGHKCVFACERNKTLSELYRRNFHLEPEGDIRAIDFTAIPDHDILCAGFPCQPFSKAGDQQGLRCPQWGDLIEYVIRILDEKKPEFFIIENVPNLIRHNNGNTWKGIISKLETVGYTVDYQLLSPHQFGIPQIRERAFIIGRCGSLSHFEWPNKRKNAKLSIKTVLEAKPKDARFLTNDQLKYLEAWQEFIERFPVDEELPSFPIWAMEFGATYPYTNQSPFGFGLSKLSAFEGSFGQPLANLSESEVLEVLPPYARYAEFSFPQWKIKFIRQNRELYMHNKNWIDDWLPSILDFPPSFQKFEWNCKGEERNLWNYIIQFRASGIRVKRATTAPSLVAMTTSQVPVIPWERRFMTIYECCKLQSMTNLTYLPETQTAAFRALGNAVNVEVVQSILKRLIAISDYENTGKVESHTIIDLTKSMPATQSSLLVPAA